MKLIYSAVLTLAIATTSGLFSACADPSQNQSQAPSPGTPNSGNMQGMDHGSMDHSSMDHGMAMDLGPADAEYDLRFIDGMTLHHQGAVEMAQDALKKSKRPEVRQLAQAIIAAQQREINQLKQWRQQWYPQASSQPMAYDAQMGHTMQMSPEQQSSMRMSGDLGAADTEYDLRFINGMIPHHEGAVTMAQDALKKSKRPEIKQLAQEIITSQQQEINQMKQWRQAWYQK